MKVLTALTVVLMLASPAHAGRFDALADRALGVLVETPSCSHTAALAALGNQGMMLISELPRTEASFRFDVDYKRQALGVTVNAASCAVKIVAKARYSRPWCEYLPGTVDNCPHELAQ